MLPWGNAGAGINPLSELAEVAAALAKGGRLVGNYPPCANCLIGPGNQNEADHAELAASLGNRHRPQEAGEYDVAHGSSPVALPYRDGVPRAELYEAVVAERDYYKRQVRLLEQQLDFYAAYCRRLDHAAPAPDMSNDGTDRPSEAGMMLTGAPNDLQQFYHLVSSIGEVKLASHSEPTPEATDTASPRHSLVASISGNEFRVLDAMIADAQRTSDRGIMIEVIQRLRGAIAHLRCRLKQLGTDAADALHQAAGREAALIEVLDELVIASDKPTGLLDKVRCIISAHTTGGPVVKQDSRLESTGSQSALTVQPKGETGNDKALADSYVTGKPLFDRLSANIEDLGPKPSQAPGEAPEAREALFSYHQMLLVETEKTGRRALLQAAIAERLQIYTIFMKGHLNLSYLPQACALLNKSSPYSKRDKNDSFRANEANDSSNSNMTNYSKRTNTNIDDEEACKDCNAEATEPSTERLSENFSFLDQAKARYPYDRLLALLSSAAEMLRDNDYYYLFYCSKFPGDGPASYRKAPQDDGSPGGALATDWGGARGLNISNHPASVGTSSYRYNSPQSGFDLGLDLHRAGLAVEAAWRSMTHTLDRLCPAGEATQAYRPSLSPRPWWKNPPASDATLATRNLPVEKLLADTGASTGFNQRYTSLGHSKIPVNTRRQAQITDGQGLTVTDTENYITKEDIVFDVIAAKRAQLLALEGVARTSAFPDVRRDAICKIEQLHDELYRQRKDDGSKKPLARHHNSVPRDDTKKRGGDINALARYSDKSPYTSSRPDGLLVQAKGELLGFF